MWLTAAVKTFVKTNIPDPAAKQRDALMWAALTRCHRNSKIVARRSSSAIFSQSYWSLQTSRGGGAASSYPAGWPFLPAWAQAPSPQVKANCHQLWSPATNKHSGCSSSENSTPAFWSGTSPSERGGICFHLPLPSLCLLSLPSAGEEVSQKQGVTDLWVKRHLACRQHSLWNMQPSFCHGVKL